jgi:isocitrate lyase
MKTQGIFSEVNDEIGEIIVADINRARIEELMVPDGVALQKLIRKQA